MGLFVVPRTHTGPEKGEPIEQMFKLKLKKLTYATCDEKLNKNIC